MVSALDSGFNGLGSSPAWGTVLCSWARYFTLIAGLSPPRCINGTGIFTVGGNPVMD